ncbi:unnamed protein product [Caenorhabditis nigoni]
MRAVYSAIIIPIMRFGFLAKMRYPKEEETGLLLFDYSSQDVSKKFSTFRRRFHLKNLFYCISLFSLVFFITLYTTFNWQKGGGDPIAVFRNLSLPSYSNFFNDNTSNTTEVNFDDPEDSEISRNLEFSENFTSSESISTTPIPFKDDCSLPVYDPWDQQIKPFIVDVDKTKHCDRTWKPYTELVNGTWRIVQEKPGMNCKARCFYLPILSGSSKISDWFPPGPVDCEFLEAVCWEGTKEVYGYIHTQIIPKSKELEKPKIENEKYPNVFVFVVDSLSAGMAKRSLPKTLEYFKTKHQAVDFPFLSQVGMRSQVNAVPLWFGKQVEAGTLKGGEQIHVDWSEDEYCKKYMDNETNLYKDFQEAGYTTLYVDDWYYQTLTSNPDCKGFEHFFTNHTFYPYTKIWEKEGVQITKNHLAGDKLCREVHLAAMEYFDQFIKVYPDRPKFTWNWFVHLAHNFLAGANRLDDPMLAWFERNFELFDNAFIIFTADHGFKLGPPALYKTEMGEFEKHNPFLQISVPKKYRDNGILEVMRENAQRLQSQYDTRATILDILKYQPSSNFTDRSTLKIPDEKGNSYLRHQPSTPRNCEHLPIPQQYCICESKSTDMKADKKLSQRLAEALIKHIHGLLDNYKITGICHRYEIDHVSALDLHTSSSSAKITYHIAVKTKHPAHFETLVTEDRRTGELKFDEIMRLDKYGSTALCSKPVHFSSLCYCRNQIFV